MNLKNQEVEAKLMDIFNDIKEGYIKDEKETIQAIEPNFQQIEVEDQILFKKYLIDHYNDFPFINNPLFQIQEQKIDNCKDLYETILSTQNWKELITYLQNKQFCIQNNIPNSWNTQLYIKLFSQFSEILPLLIQLNNMNSVSLGYNYIKIIRNLLEIIEITQTRKDIDQQNLIEQAVGQLLKIQILQFQEFKEFLKFLSQEKFYNMILEIQQFQLKSIEKIDLVRYEKPFQVFIQICTRNYDQQSIQKYLNDLFKIDEQSQQNQPYSIIIDDLIYRNENIEECYYTLVFYFQLKYCNKFNLESDWQKFGKEMQKLVSDSQKQQTQLQRTKKRFSEIQDETYQFLVNSLVYTSETPLNLQYILENYQYFQIQEQNNYNILSKFSDQIFKTIITQADKLEMIFKSFKMVSFQKFSLIFKQDPNIYFKFQLLDFLNQNNQPIHIIQNIINESQNQTLSEFSNFLESCEMFPSNNKPQILALVAQLQNFPLDQVQIFIQLFRIEQSFQKGSILCQIQQITDNKYLDLNKIQLQSMEQFTIADWKIAYSILNCKLKVFFTKLFDLYQKINLNQSQIQTLYVILNQLAPTFVFKFEEGLFVIKKFLCEVPQIKFQQLFCLNIQQAINDQEYVEIIQILFQIFNQQDLKQVEKILENLSRLSNNSIFQFDLLNKLIQKKISNNIIQQVLLVYFYNNQKLQKQQIELCEEIFQEFPEKYEEIFAENSYFNNILLHPKFLVNKEIQLKIPTQPEICLEDFNISLIIMSDEQKQQIIQQWKNSMNNKSIFKKLIPLYFDVIKRKEQSKKFLSMVNNIGIEKFNMKALFQILFNNSNHELKSMLLKLQCTGSSLPLLYLNPIINSIKEEKDLYCLNEKIIYIFPKCFPIISFSLSKKQTPIGKTDLINKVFYKQEIFEVRDNCKLNQNTVDIMFDFCFGGSRQFAIGDIHGSIPFKILTKLLSLFKFWIIQMNTEDELQENFEQIKLLKEQEKNQTAECCFIVRNAKNLEIRQQNQIESLIIQSNISILKVMDLTQKDLDQQTLNSQIDLFSKFILNKIEAQYKKTQQNNELSDQKEFLQLIKSFYGHDSPLVQEIKQENQIISSLDLELKKFITSKDGFYSIDAFPMRAVAWKIKQLKDKQTKLDGLTLEQQYNLIDSKKKEIDILEQKIPYLRPSSILKLFQQIFFQKNHYILYLQFTDIIRKFNETHTFSLQDKNQIINEELSKLKLQQIQKQNQNQDQDQTQEQNQNKIQNEINYKQRVDYLKKQLEENLKNISLLNIGIELFWRELIAIKQKGLAKDLDIDPVEIISKMIKKGEPFEFLDGDQLQIDQQFLTSLMEQFSDPDKEKVLVLSILGPQSSGKSTILNKIFGCHFWTSVGRCTKGIYLQLLKISNKSYFDNQFDYILILDTEGLYNPNQTDHEFDKKIALFILAISDIIVITVKGDIHSQFKNLVEMCIFTLGQMKSAISSIKQLSWCFNQNNDCDNFQPFQQQIQSIANELNLQINQNEIVGENKNLDYNEIFDIKKQNIRILGFSSIEQSWRINQMNGVFENWRQLIINETFSEEAYIFGVQMIKQFSLKFKDQSEQLSMPSFSQIIQNIESNWQSICRLPDLLEFTELLQYKQDQEMKKQFEVNYSGLFLDFHLNIPKKIQSDLPEGKINLDVFRQCEKQQKDYIKTEILIIQNKMKEKLLQIQTENQIQKKIHSKYSKILEERLQSYSYQCDLVIFDEIKKHETDYQQKKGFQQIENLVSQISQDSSALQQLKGHPDLLKEKFDTIWSLIIDKSIEQQENIFRDFSLTQYQSINSSFTQYNFKSDYQKDFQSKFLKEINKNSPFKGNENEKLQTYLIFENEFKKQQQFKCLQKENLKNPYLDKFHQKIEDRLKKRSDQYMINLHHYYYIEVQLILVKKQDFQNYLQLNIFEDFLYFSQQYHKKDEQILQKFFQLIFFFVTCDQNKYGNLIKWMFNGSSFKFWKNEEELLKEKFDTLKRIFKFEKNKEIYVDSQEHAKQLSYYYPNLKIEKITYYVNDENEFQNLITQQQENNIIFLSQKEIVPKQQQYENTLLYICDQQKNYQFQNDFNKNGVKLFELIMDEQQGWIKLYSQIYDIIKLEMIKSNQRIIQSDCIDQEEIVSSDMNLIQIIMTKIQQKIIEFNSEFSNFGVILKDVGERCIYYYSIFIIWRFQCYKQWRSLEQNQQKFKNMKEEQLMKFTADIQQNKNEQSILSAQGLAKDIKQGFLDKFYLNNLEKISKSIMQNNLSCYDIVKQLDKEILENYSTNNKNMKYSDQEVLNYIVDQKQFIEKYVDKQITIIEEEVKTHFENQLRQELKQYMKLIFHNVDIIHKHVYPQIESVKSEEYFDYNETELNTQNCESKLFQLIQNCIQGDYLNQVNTFKVNYNFRDIFELKQYTQIRVPIFIKTSNESEQQIKLLKPFIQELYKQFKDFIEKSDNEQIMLRNNQIQHCWNKLKLDMNGCQHSCPMCKRKCDQQNDNNHKHTCRNGHQLRGMNGVLINNYPSLYTCEEIDDEAEITTLETNIKKKWREIQKAYSDWNFKYLKVNEIEMVKEKMTNVWNNGIGPFICNYLKEKLKKLNIFFKRKSEIIQFEYIHYILMLDDSYSMQGQNWEKAKQGALDCMKEIEKNPYAKVSVIIFNHEARVSINCEKVNIDQQKEKINFKGGETDFGKAFKLAYYQFVANRNLDFIKTIFLFYTDGYAPYPHQEVELFCNLPIENKTTIEFICCSDIPFIESLFKIIKQFTRNKIFANLKSNVKVDDISKVFTEVVSQYYHNLKC